MMRASKLEGKEDELKKHLKERLYSFPVAAVTNYHRF